MILAFGFGEDIPIIVALLLILFILILIRKYFFKISAKINKIRDTMAILSLTFKFGLKSERPSLTPSSLNNM